MAPGLRATLRPMLALPTASARTAPPPMECRAPRSASRGAWSTTSEESFAAV